jgi:hypothetical protein
MAEQQTNAELADRYSRKRARMLPALTVIFLTQQAAYLSNAPTGRAVDQVRIGAWSLLATVLLLLVVTGGAWIRPRAIRALMDDEVTRANRASALGLGFTLAMAMGIGLWVFAPMLELTGRQAIHFIVSIGLASALIRFGLLERRALG